MRTKLIVVGLLCALGVGLAATTGFAGIEDSAHDFKAQGWAGGEICVPCHTPHDADTTVTGSPLWNHTVSGATYTVYSSPSLDATMGQPAGSSLLCLSCHDGTVAVDSFGDTPGTTMYVTTGLLGIDLSDDHPIGITYDSATDGGLFDPGTTTALGGTIDEDLLIAGDVECASCHDVHNDDDNTSLLKISNTGSDLCLTCHDK